jgi:hypothetical protein
MKGGREAVLLIIFYIIIAIFLYIFTDPDTWKSILKLISK